MDKEERNRVMDRLLKNLNGIDLRDLTYLTLPTDVEVLRECDKLARAWDTLSKEVDEHLSGFAGTRNKMDRILSDLTPPLKDPLDELFCTIAKMEPWGTTQSPAVPMKMLLDREGVLAEIRRLRGKK